MCVAFGMLQTAEEAVPEGSAALNLRVTRGDVGLDRAHEHIFQICGRLFRAKSRAQRDAVVLLLYGCLENAYSVCPGCIYTLATDCI